MLRLDEIICIKILNNGTYQMIENLKIGDVIVEELPEGYYGCMVVLEVDKKGKECLVMISKYFSKEKPTIGNPILMQSALNKVTTRQMDYQNRWGEFYQNSNLYEVIGSVNVSNIKINDIILYENLTTMSLYYEWLSKERPEEFYKMI